MTELVSILIPAYNSEKWISDTIKSAINQDWANKEVIVVNDGSTDNTLSVVKSFASKTVKVVTQENSGASAARNKALSIAQGDYIQWLDADDLLAPDKISQQLKNSEHGADSRILLSSAWGKFFSLPNRAQFKKNNLWQDLDPIDWIIIKFTENTFMANSSWLFSRKLIDLTGAWDERLSLDDDGEYACRAVLKAERVKFVANAKCYYRVDNVGSQSFMKTNKALHSQFLSMHLCIKHLKQVEDTERTSQASLKFLNDYYSFFFPDHPTLAKSICDLATTLGGELNTPNERYHNILLNILIGPSRAKIFKHTYNRHKLIGLKFLEKFLHHHN